ncbi:hypothetical protein HA72_0928 [Metallosphaera sedula]|uniref:MIP18 family-like domain-containing protein n=3 Tax=Metallosphaera TaxID=41980 RepID=A4YF98_METS5|nr:MULTISPECIES: hypothetical protein [Metallosphaera]ABP95100.1 hypothetical protein Msed_0928 [Metallosphaera sedula DSM 5348]AIM27086.1 hypothetical protein HA72_0928 [Metallosphaera sedula]AKV73999.1 hypothetical protein MsedA_0944 [Metallosphaera sedula]AKV76238.1 hypothetical protein MsedB_0945 [Metallosphaera sedula]AKV78491.1 hypothetical protein MsedC_0944 [Metallosphaera sedula]
MGEDLDLIEALSHVIEPESGVPAVKLGLLRIERSEKLRIIYTPPSPFVPPILVIKVAMDIARRIQGAEVIVERYFLGKEINERIKRLGNNGSI